MLKDNYLKMLKYIQIRDRKKSQNDITLGKCFIPQHNERIYGVEPESYYSRGITAALSRS